MCRAEWCVLDGEVSGKRFEFITEDKGKQLLDSEELDVQRDLFYHHKCYQKFRNKQLIEQAVKHVAKRRRK
jgi:hypothetical protein